MQAESRRLKAFHLHCFLSLASSVAKSGDIFHHTVVFFLPENLIQGDVDVLGGSDRHAAVDDLDGAWRQARVSLNLVEYHKIILEELVVCDLGRLV